MHALNQYLESLTDEALKLYNRKASIHNKILRYKTKKKELKFFKSISKDHSISGNIEPLVILEKEYFTKKMPILSKTPPTEWGEVKFVLADGKIYKGNYYPYLHEISIPKDGDKIERSFYSYNENKIPESEVRAWIYEYEID